MITWTSDDGDCTISVQFDRHDFGRVQYRWTVAADDRTYTGDDLRSGSGSDVNEVGMLPTLASFLGAWVEAQRYDGSENRDLFPDEMLDIAEGYSDEFYMAVSRDE